MQTGTGSEIKRLRKEQGLPVVVLAARAETSPATVHYWEAWQIPPKTKAIRERIAAALGVDLASIEGHPSAGASDNIK